MNCNCYKKEVPDGIFCVLCGWDQRKSSEPPLNILYVQWKNHHFKKLSISGRKSYHYAWRHLEQYGDRQLSSITLDELQHLLDTLSGKSKSLQEKVQALIGQLYQFAMLFDYVHINYAPYLILNGYKKNEYTPLTYDEIKLLFKHAHRTDRIGQTSRIILILIFTGWRPEELFSMQKDAVHLKERYFISGSKTEAGKNRIMPIATCIYPFVVDFWMKARPGETLIKSSTGKKVSLNNWRKRDFYPCMRELGINKPDDPHRIKPYAMRHTFATLAYQAGVKPDLLIKMIGHTNIKFTSKVYIHNNIAEYAREIQKVSSLFEEQSIRHDESRV